MTRRKYNFPSRAAAEDEIRRLGQQVTLHGIALYCVARNEITWTEFQRGEFGYRCRAGIARASSGHGGLLFIEEHCPANRGPILDVFWADRFLRDLASMPRMHAPDGQAWERAIYAARAIRDAQDKQPTDCIQPGHIPLAAV